MLKKITYALMLSLLFTACGGGGNDGGTEPTAKELAIAKITAYATEGTTAPTLQDYLDAGVSNLDATNIEDINEVVENLSKEDVDTTAELQALADALGVTIDTEAPVITLIGTDANISVGDTYTDAGATATDNVDGNLTATIVTSNPVDTTTAGTYTVTYDVNDTARNSAVPVSRTVTVNAPTITHNGTTYGFVTSPHTGKVWLDKNLGAARVCESFNDTACYGDYYQWGRNFDGHEDSGSATTSTQATDINSAGSDFITSNSANSYDWAKTADSDGSLRSANWSKTDGTSVCPVGYRVPTIAELRAETLDNGVTNRATAFSSFLKLPSAGVRGYYSSYYSGTLSNQGSWSGVWSGSVYGSYSRSVGFNSGYAYEYYYSRAYGFAVRCLRD